jgi:hypothetical protein
VDRKRLEGRVAFAHRRIIADPGAGRSLRGRCPVAPVAGSAQNLDSEILAASRGVAHGALKNVDSEIVAASRGVAHGALQNVDSEIVAAPRGVAHCASRTSIRRSLPLHATIAGSARITGR